MTETSLQKFLKELFDNLNILEQREAKYANAAPLGLLNQIDDYHYAIDLTRQALDRDVPLDELQMEFRGLNLELDGVVFIAQEPPPRKEFTGENPYRGLRKFTEADADLFFGRNAAIQSLLGIVKHLIDADTSRDVPDLVAVLGPSGSGKSSLVRAGLIPALRRGCAEDSEPQSTCIAGSDQWPIKVMVPGAHPLDALAAQFVDLTGRGFPALRADLDTGEQALHQLMLECLVDKPDDAVFVLVIDQFEELFTLCENEAERQRFLAQLLHVSQTRHNRGFIILTMRADFYAKAAQYKDLAQVITRNQMLVSPMTERELREAILLPAEAVGLELEKALVESLLKDTADAPGVLPLLQHTLLELFERRDGNLLTLEAYQEIGGVQGSLAHRADAIMNGLTAEQQRVARRIFMRLIQPGEGTMDTRRRATFDEVLTQTIQVEAVDDVVQTLIGGNLLITGRNPDTDEVVLDVSHEALIQEWPQLRRWLDEDRRGFQIHRQLSQAARLWEERNRDKDSLYRGARLLDVEEWLAANPDEINPSEAAFIEACRTARDRNRRRTRMVIAGLAAGLVVAVLGAVFGWWGQQRAATERDNAQVAQARAEEQARIARAGQLAAEAQNAIDMWPQRAQLLALEALEVTRQKDGPRLPAAEQALRDAWLKAGGTPLSDHNFGVDAAAISPDGQWLATGSWDGTILLWDLADPEADPLNFSDTGFPVTAVAVSPESEWLIIGSWDGTIRLQDLADPETAPQTLSGHNDWISAMAVTPDGEWLVTGSDDGTVLMWDLLNPDAEPVFVSEHDDTITVVEISPDGQWLITGSGNSATLLWNLFDPEATPIFLLDQAEGATVAAFSLDNAWLATGSLNGTVLLWDLADPDAEPIILDGHTDEVTAMAFSPDGESLATGSADNTALWWDLTNMDPIPFASSLHQDDVSGIVFSPDSQWLATGSRDHNVFLWDLDKSDVDPIVLSGHDGEISVLAVSPDSQRLVTGSRDGTNQMRQWDLTDPDVDYFMLSGQEDEIRSLTISPDGQQLATGGRDGTLLLWDLHQPNADPLTLSGHEYGITSLAISPDGKWLASGGEDGLIQLWDLTHPQAKPLTLSAHQSWISAMAVSPDNQWLVSGSGDGTGLIWDLNNPGERHPLSGHGDTISVVAISPVGDWLITGSEDGIAILCSLIDSDFPPVSLPGHEDAITAVAISPDGKWLATGSKEGTALLWDLRNPGNTDPFVLSGHRDQITSMAISPDSRWLVTGSFDHTVRLWDLADPSANPLMLSGHAHEITAVTISPDGQWIVTGSADHTTRLWDIAHPHTDPVVLSGHEDDVTAVSISPDGQWLITGSSDGTARLWNLNLDVLMAEACATVGRNLTADEWDQFLGAEVAYRRTCPDHPIYPTVIEAARDLAREGQVEEAVAQFNHLLTLDPMLDLDPETEAQQAYQDQVDKLLAYGKFYAREGYLAQAVIKFQQALKLNPDLPYTDPQAEVERLAQGTAANRIEEGIELAQNGNLAQALVKFTEIQQSETNYQIPAEAWHTLCAQGGQWSQPELVVDACNRAIELDPENGQYNNSRGLVYLLLGESDKARKDFRVFEAWLAQE